MWIDYECYFTSHKAGAVSLPCVGGDAEVVEASGAVAAAGAVAMVT